MPTEWKSYLSVGKNKECLLSFLSTDWSCNPNHLPEGVTLYVGEGKSCVSITKQHQSESPIIQKIESLRCDNEESDTRLILHAKHASDQGYSSVVVRTPDTDVIVILACLEQRIMCELYVETGVGDRKRLIDINKVSASLPSESCKALIRFHAFTGTYQIVPFY